MPPPQFADLNVECWEFSGKLGTSTPTLCLFHAKLEFGRPILDALDQLRAESPPAHRTLTFKPSSRQNSFAKMRLQLALPDDQLRVMRIASESGTAFLQMTATGLQVLYQAVSAWCNGSEDFGIGPRNAKPKKHELGTLDKSSGELWFWGPTMEP